MLYSFPLSSGPFETPQNITLTFEYHTNDLIFKKEYLTQFSLNGSDELYPNIFGRIDLNSTYLFMTPMRYDMGEWSLRGDLYGFDEEPFPTN